MNTLVLLLMTAVPNADPLPMIQGQPGSVIQSPSAPMATYDSGDSSWWSRTRSGPGLFPRLRSFFNRGRVPDALQSSPGYPAAMNAPVTSEGRLVPTPVLTPPVTSGPHITYGTGPAPLPAG